MIDVCHTAKLNSLVGGKEGKEGTVLVSHATRRPLSFRSHWNFPCTDTGTGEPNQFFWCNNDAKKWTVFQWQSKGWYRRKEEGVLLNESIVASLPII